MPRRLRRWARDSVFLAELRARAASIGFLIGFLAVVAVFAALHHPSIDITGGLP